MSFFSFLSGLGFPAVKWFKLGLAWFDLTGDGPDKAGEFTGDGGDGDLGLSFTRAGEMDAAVVQTALRFLKRCR